ncbi:MAG TPA: hypothetical protein VFA39_04325 [Steroidobacteraceae bacterium]|nr:hypothetical protein [Steroidobacteraceae bacterium]
MSRKGQQNGRCAICTHERRYEIELALVSGVSCRAVGSKYGVHRDAAWRHLRNHVPPERRTELVAGPLKPHELAQRAADEGMTLLEYLSMVRNALMARFLAASEADDRSGTSMVAGRLLECLRLTAQLSGELTKTTASITNNTLILQSPLMADLQAMLVSRLRPYPEASRAVLEGLKELSARALEGSQQQRPALEAPRDG